VGCYVSQPIHSVPFDELKPDQRREQIVQDAEQFIHARQFRVEGRSFPYDCSGFIGAVLLKSGIDVFRGAAELDIRGNGVRILHTYLEKYGALYGTSTPEPGDIIFFSNTYDRNRDRRPNDLLTHAGIVERIDANGTVVFIHLSRKEIQRDSINLLRPSLHEDMDGTILNDYLRRRRRHDARGTRYLAAELFAGFGSIFPKTQPVSLTEPPASSTKAPLKTPTEENP
jgi:peptidoglycan DL-endopeptidase CwlO